MATNVFKHAKTVQKKHPKMSWQQCVKKAGVELKKKKRTASKGKRISGVKKSSAIQKINRKIKRSGVRVERINTARKSSVPKKINVSIGAIKNTGITALNDKYGKLAVRKLHATKKTIKRKLQKEMTAVHAQIRKFKSL